MAEAMAGGVVDIPNILSIRAATATLITATRLPAILSTHNIRSTLSTPAEIATAGIATPRQAILSIRNIPNTQAATAAGGMGAAGGSVTAAA
jgi:hypothetical protein